MAKHGNIHPGAPMPKCDWESSGKESEMFGIDPVDQFMNHLLIAKGNEYVANVLIHDQDLISLRNYLLERFPQDKFPH